jgi:hypothetical protein
MHNTADKPTTLNDVVHFHNEIAHRVEAELPSNLLKTSPARLPPGSVPKNWRSMATLATGRPLCRRGGIARALLILGVNTLARHNEGTICGVTKKLEPADLPVYL